MENKQTMIEVQNLCKSFHKLEVLKDISTTFYKNEVVSIIGPSGGGKSTFLRCLNLLEKPTSGHIVFDGVDICDRHQNKNIDLHRQKMGMVFQQFNLFNNMNVMKNLTVAPMRIKKMPKEQAEEKKQLLQQLKGKETITKDGKKIKLYANIGNSKDLAMVLQNDAEGIGLFRSEFLYLEKEDYPTENEQFMVYKMVAETMAGKQVIIRTLDIGADKQCDYFNMDPEDNPALGYRAIRICLTRPEVFKTQLRALYRASAFGNISIMYPMITSVWEVKQIKKIVEEVKEELRSQNIEFGEVAQGIMIETPAAVMISRELAKEVDFFSIGTNDLTQYTLAIDRQNPKLDDFYDAHHPAVLEMIRMVAQNAHAEGIWAGICGELGADLELTEQFLQMGIDELSVSPGRILPIRKIVRESECGCE